MITRIRSNSALSAALVPIAVLIAVYVLVPTATAWTGGFVSGFIAGIQTGPKVLESGAFHKFLSNGIGFFGQLSLLLTSGLLASWVWRKKQLAIFAEKSRWIEIAIGVLTGLLTFYCSKKLIVPWLYAARPVGSEWISNQYAPVSSYPRRYINQIANLFFLDGGYIPLVETIIFVGFMYCRFRSQWSIPFSILLGSLIFSALHRDELFFLQFFLFGLINFALYEWRKSLAAPLFHHVIFNGLIYGSQLAFFSPLPAK